MQLSALKQGDAYLYKVLIVKDSQPGISLAKNDKEFKSDREMLDAIAPLIRQDEDEPTEEQVLATLRAGREVQWLRKELTEEEAGKLGWLPTQK